MNLERPRRKKEQKTEPEPLLTDAELLEIDADEEKGTNSTEAQRKKLAELIEQLAKTPPREEPPVEEASPTLETITTLRAWERYRTRSAWAIPIDLDSETFVLRSAIFDLVRTSGLGPREGEALETYVARVNRERAGATTSHIRPTIFETVDHTFLARGGDFEARSFLAVEYLRKNPNVSHVYVEGATPDAPELDYTRKTLEGGEVKLTKVTSGLAGAKEVF